MSENSSVALLRRFHELITNVAGRLLDSTGIEMPKLPVDVGEKCYFSVPGMYGGFSYWLKTFGDDHKLVVTSWSRIVEDSEQTFEITAEQTNRL